MARLTNFIEQEFLNHMLGKAAWTMPPDIYLTLLTSDPTETGDLSGEIAGGNYARFTLSDNLGLATNGGLINNVTEVEFNTASAIWGTIAYLGVMPSSAGSEMYMYAPVPTPVYVNEGDILRFNINKLTFLAD